MAARLSLARATLTLPDQELRNVHVQVRGTQASARLGRAVVAQRDDVTAVVPQANRTYLITFDDGTTWTAQRVRCGSCGGGR